MRASEARIQHGRIVDAGGTGVAQQALEEALLASKEDVEIFTAIQVKKLYI